MTRERDEVRRELAELEEEIRIGSRLFRAGKAADHTGVSDLARRLGMTVVVLWVGTESGRAFLLPPGGGMTVVELPGLNDTQLREWLMGPANGTTLGGWLGAYAGHASSQAGADRWRDQLAVTLRDLGKVVMGPIRSQLPPGERSMALLVSGLLNLLPLHAASREEHGEIRSFVHDGIAVCYAPSAWVLRRCVERSRPGWAPVLGVADPQSNLGYGDWELDVMERLFAALDPSEPNHSARRLGGHHRCRD